MNYNNNQYSMNTRYQKLCSKLQQYLPKFHRKLRFSICEVMPLFWIT